MKVAALLVNYRDAAGTAAAARSVLEDDIGVELVVVDNSDDESHWHALLHALPPRAKRVRAPGNLGFGQGCNLAMQHTDAPLLLLVNPDVRLWRGCVAHLRQALLRDSSLGAVAPRQFLDEGGSWMLPPAWLPTSLRAWATEKVMRSPALQPRWSRALWAESLRIWAHDGVLAQRALSGGVMMVRRNALVDTGTLFDPRFFMYFEDADLCLRLRRQGRRLALVTAARAVHAWRNAPHKAALMQQGMERFFEKHHGPGDRWQAKRLTLTGPANWAVAVEALERQELTISGGEMAGETGIPWEDGWCVEVSPYSHLWPAVGQVGRGWDRVDLRSAIEALSSGAPVHVRLSSLRDSTLGHARQWIHRATASPS